MDCCCFLEGGEEGRAGYSSWALVFHTNSWEAGRVGGYLRWAINGPYIFNEIIRHIGAVHTEESLNNHYYTDHYASYQ